MITTEEKMFDLSYLEEMDDPEFMIRVIELYLTEMPNDLLAMNRALKTGDFEIIKINAHKLKSSTGMLQASKLFTLLQQTESLVCKHLVHSHLQDKLKEVNIEFELLKHALQKHIQSLKAKAA